MLDAKKAYGVADFVVIKLLFVKRLLSLAGNLYMDLKRYMTMSAGNFQ